MAVENTHIWLDGASLTQLLDHIRFDLSYVLLYNQ